MLILAIDTSGPAGGVTLAEAQETSFRLIESSAIAGGMFSAQLIPTIAALLKRHEFSAAQIGGFAAASGPGSFTGLRVGLSAIKGLAETLHKPIATVSVLEALAALSEAPGKTAVAMDAGRKEIYFGLYQTSGDAPTGMVKIREQLLTQDQFLAVLAAENLAVAITSDAAIAEFGQSCRIAVQQVNRPTSEDVARIGARKLLGGDTVSVDELDANYLRRSDAEIFFKGIR